MHAIFKKSNYASPIGWPKQFLYDLKCCFDRFRKGYCERDLWCMRDWFLCVIPDMLEELDQKRCGFPTVLEHEYYEQHKEELNMSFEEFVCIPADKTSNLYRLQEQANQVCDARWSETLREIAHYLREAGDNDEKDDSYRAACLSKGLAMFEKHFNHLWD